MVLQVRFSLTSIKDMLLSTLMDLPRCRNETCPRYKSNAEMILLREDDTSFLFGCRACKGIHHITKTSGWKRATQENLYRQRGRPEYARDKALFFYGRYK
jgi:hypothetical protein